MRVGSVRWQLSWCLVCILLSIWPTPTLALRCLQCEDCGISVGEPSLCRSGQDMCMKLHSPGRVDRTCATQESCGYGVTMRWGRRFWRQIKHFVSDWGKRSQWEMDEDVTEVFCCASDFCNSATSNRNENTNCLLILICVLYSVWA